MKQNQIIDDLIDYWRRNQETYEDDSGELTIDYLDYYDFKNFIMSLQEKYMGHVNPEMYPKWKQ